MHSIKHMRISNNLVKTINFNIINSLQTNWANELKPVKSRAIARHCGDLICYHCARRQLIDMIFK